MQKDNGLFAGAKCELKSAGSGGRAPMHCYGWDSQSGTWHGPNEIDAAPGPARRLLRSMCGAAGRSWYGHVSCGGDGAFPTRFFALVHDLADCAMAAIYCAESKAGPAEIIAILPGGRRAHLRPDFAFEFVSFAQFLGAVNPAAALQVHDGIAAAIAEERNESTLVFSITSGIWPSDQDHVLSRCVETVAVAVSDWLSAADQRA